MGYRRSAQADEDYFAICGFGLGRYGRATAEAYLDRLDQTFDMLSAFPGAARVRHEVDPALRAFPVGVYLILYEVDEMDEVTILRIVHARSDGINDYPRRASTRAIAFATAASIDRKLVSRIAASFAATSGAVERPLSRSSRARMSAST